MKRQRQDYQVNYGNQVNQEIGRGTILQLDQPKRPRSCWRIPPITWWKVNTCGGQRSYGFCIRGLDGDLVVAGVKQAEVWGCSQEIEEAKALYYGLQKAFGFGYRRVVAESSCPALIKMLRDGEMLLNSMGSDVAESLLRLASRIDESFTSISTLMDHNSEMGRVVDQILQLTLISGKFDACSFSYVESYGNCLAYEMSKFTVYIGVAVWLKDFPKFASDIATWDIFSCLSAARARLHAETTNIQGAPPIISKPPPRPPVNRRSRAR